MPKAIVRNLDEIHSQQEAMVLRKHVDTVHAGVRMTLKERQCANALLLNAMRNTGDSEELKRQRKHTIIVSDLCDELFNDRNNRTKLRKTLNGLMTKKVEWDFTTEQNKRTTGASTWLAGYEITDGRLSYSYSPQIMEKVLSPDIWARLNFSIQHLIKSTHAQSLYEQCARYRDLGQTQIWSLDVFRGLMGLQGLKSYQQFRKLNDRVIGPAVVEINQKTEIYIEPIFYREQRRIKRIQFKVSGNTGYMGPTIPGNRPRLNSKSKDDEVLGEVLEDHAELYEKLLLFGITHTKAVAILAAYEEEYVEGNLDVVIARIRHEGNDIRNVAGYAIKAIENDYRPPERQNKRQAALGLDGQKERQKEERKRSAAQKRLGEFEMITLPRWRTECWEKSTAADLKRQAFEEFREEEIDGNPFLSGKYRENPTGPSIMGNWRRWIQTHQLSDPTEEERQACADELEFDLNGYRKKASVE